MWWYIYSTYQYDSNKNLDKEKTLMCLESFNTDYIVQLTERTSTTSNPILTRCLTKELSEKNIENQRNYRRNTMKYNTAKLMTIEPAFYDGAEEGYAKMIVDYFFEGRGNKDV